MEGHYAAAEREQLIQHIAEQDAQIKALEEQGLVLLQRVARVEDSLNGTEPHETQKTITDWAVATFGKAPSIAHILDRAEDEFFELKEAIANGNPEKIAEEIADVRIVLCQISERLGYNEQAAVDAKMKINRARQWETNGDGTGKHIK